MLRGEATSEEYAKVLKREVRERRHREWQERREARRRGFWRGLRSINFGVLFGRRGE
jgi:hypothetical protein